MIKKKPTKQSTKHLIIIYFNPTVKGINWHFILKILTSLFFWFFFGFVLFRRLSQTPREPSKNCWKVHNGTILRQLASATCWYNCTLVDMALTDSDVQKQVSVERPRCLNGFGFRNVIDSIWRRLEVKGNKHWRQLLKNMNPSRVHCVWRRTRAIWELVVLLQLGLWK